MDILDRFEELLPLVSQWVKDRETHILEYGEPLTTDQKIDAHLVGVTNIEQVKVLVVKEVPTPNHPLLYEVAKKTGMISSYTMGISFRYGILIQENYRFKRPLMVHELAHTMQYERFGGVQPFLRQYLYECLEIGYPNSPLELEAVKMERTVCGN
ncbi:MAG: hypothetical protein AAGI38_05040 [Bacteroidota bacterium]